MHSITTKNPIQFAFQIITNCFVVIHILFSKYAYSILILSKKMHHSSFFGILLIQQWITTIDCYNARSPERLDSVNHESPASKSTLST